MHSQFPYHVFVLTLVQDEPFVKQWEYRCRECGVAPADGGQ